MRKLALLLALTSSLSTLRAQTASERVEVRVIDVDVIVTDKAGNPIRGLPREAFELAENGKKQVISNFSEIGSSVTPATDASQPLSAPTVSNAEVVRPPRRQFVFFFDGVAMSKLDADRFFNSLVEFVATSVRPEDEVTVATWEGRRLNVTVEPKDDRGVLSRELRRLYLRSLPNRESADEAMIRSGVESAEKDVQQNPEANAAGARYDAEGSLEAAQHAAGEERWVTMRLKTNALNRLLRRFGNPETKKVLLLISQEFVLDAGGVGPLSGQGSPSQEGVRLYGIAGSGIASPNSTYGMMKILMNAANSRGFTIFSMHPRGTAPSGSDQGDRPYEEEMQRLARTENEARTLRLVAAATGGTAAVGAVDVATQLSQASRLLDSYYSLGYRPQGEPRSRALSVRVIGHPDYIVRARDHFVERTAKEEFQDNVVANLYDEIETPGYAIQLLAGTPRRSRGKLRIIPLEIRIPYDAIALLPSGKKYRGGFTLHVMAGKPNGDLSKMIEQKQEFELTSEQREQARGKFMIYNLSVEIGAPEQIISVAVVDAETRQAAYARWREAAAPQQRKTK